VSPTVRPARDASEREEALALRHAVFCVEQDVPLDEELDGRDAEALQLVALESGAVLGTCRLLLEGERAVLGRMAVAAPARGRGIGAALLEAADAAARAAGARHVVLAAQLAARGLYERYGYAASGASFLDAGIEHVRMEKPLA